LVQVKMNLDSFLRGVNPFYLNLGSLLRGVNRFREFSQKIKYY